MCCVFVLCVCCLEPRFETRACWVSPLCTVQASWRVCCGMTWTPAAPWSSLGPTSGGRRPCQPRSQGHLVVEVDVQGLVMVVGEGASGPRARAVRGRVVPMARPACPASVAGAALPFPITNHNQPIYPLGSAPWGGVGRPPTDPQWVQGDTCVCAMARAPCLRC